MRIRTIKPDFWPHRMHSRISEAAALLAVGLLNVADDEGRFEADPQAILMCLFPRRPPSRTVAVCLEELREARWIVLYDVTLDGQQVKIGQVAKFSKHQVINRFRASSFPPPPKGLLMEDSHTLHLQRTEEAGHDEKTSENTAAGAVTPSQEEKGAERRKEGAAREADSAAPWPEAEIPSLAEVLGYCAGPAGIPTETGRAFWEYYQKTAYPPWTDGGKKHFQWRGKLQKWAINDRSEKPGQAKTGSTESRTIQLEAELEASRDPQERERLREELRKLRGEK